LSGPVIEAMSPPRPPLPSKRLVIRSRKTPARWSGGLFFRRPACLVRCRSPEQACDQPAARPIDHGLGELAGIVGLLEHRAHFGDFRRDVLRGPGSEDDVGRSGT